MIPKRTADDLCLVPDTLGSFYVTHPQHTKETKKLIEIYAPLRWGGVRERRPSGEWHVLERRKPRLLLRLPGSFLLRYADRQLSASLFPVSDQGAGADDPVRARFPSALNREV
jgi:hypothetical protein